MLFTAIFTAGRVRGSHILKKTCWYSKTYSLKLWLLSSPGNQQKLDCFCSMNDSLFFIRMDFNPCVEKCLKIYFYVSTERLHSKEVNIASAITGKDGHVFPYGTTGRFTYERLKSTWQLSTSNASHTSLQAPLALSAKSSPIVITGCI